MKRTLATALSVAGVLAAGASAYAVNTSVLGGTTKTDSAQAQSAPVETLPAPESGNVGAQNGAALVSDAQATPTPVTDTTTTYKVGDAGSVVLSTASGSIEVVSIMPATGWEAEPARIRSNGSVKVHFYSQSTRLEFVAQLVDGDVIVSVTTDSMSRPGATGTPGSHDDDDDDENEHHEGEDTDDDHESDEDSGHMDDD